MAPWSPDEVMSCLTFLATNGVGISVISRQFIHIPHDYFEGARLSLVGGWSRPNVLLRDQELTASVDLFNAFGHRIRSPRSF